MTFLEGLALVGSSATIFGFIMGIFSVFNGRITRKEIIKVIKETQNLIISEAEESRKILKAMQTEHGAILRALGEIPRGI